jgi:hypothetical protein
MYANSLLPAQITEVGVIFSLIHKQRELYRRASVSLDDFLAKFERDKDLNAGRRQRLFAYGRMPRDPSLSALLYDFLTLELPTVLRKFADKKSQVQEIQSRVDALRKQVNARINRHDNPFAVLARDIEPDDVDRRIPDVFINKFIGYRRSSHGEIVRFFIQISQNKNRERAVVSFKNIYRRGQHKWLISGAGIYAKNDVLYLFGHARDMQDQSRGYRIFALRQLGTTNMLCGPLTTMDEHEPISARVLLIPWKSHNFTEAQQAMSPTALLRHMVQTKRHRVHSDEYEDFIDEIRKNVSDCFPVRRDQGLFHYISNITSDVIHCTPKDDDALIQQELRLRVLAHNSRYGIRDELVDAIRNHTDGKNRM